TDRGMIYPEPPFGHHFLQIAQRQAIPQVPSDAQHDDVVLKVTATEQRRSSPPHGCSPYQTRTTSVATDPPNLWQQTKWLRISKSQGPCCQSRVAGLKGNESFSSRDCQGRRSKTAMAYELLRATNLIRKLRSATFNSHCGMPEPATTNLV